MDRCVSVYVSVLLRMMSTSKFTRMFEYMCVCKCFYARMCAFFVCKCVRVASPAVLLSKFKLSCGNISLALQSTCVTWWTQGSPHNKQCHQGCWDPHHLRSELLKIHNMASADEKCVLEGVQTVLVPLLIGLKNNLCLWRCMVGL